SRSSTPEPALAGDSVGDADPIGGGTYRGTVAGGGTISLTVDADGSTVTNFEISGITCSSGRSETIMLLMGQSAVKTSSGLGLRPLVYPSRIQNHGFLIQAGVLNGEAILSLTGGFFAGGKARGSVDLNWPGDSSFDVPPCVAG